MLEHKDIVHARVLSTSVWRLICQNSMPAAMCGHLHVTAVALHVAEGGCEEVALRQAASGNSGASRS